MNVLLLDIGNSRLKPAWLGADGPQALPVVVHEAAAAAALLTLPLAQPPQAIWISQVLGAQAEAELTGAARSRFGLTPHFARSAARIGRLRSAYAEPQRLGVDRWLAMLALVDAAPDGAVIVDAGTALTADWIDAGGAHQGGFIAAGLLAAQAGVLGATRFATRDLRAVYDGGLGRDTEACVRQGAMLGCLGAIDRAAALAGPGARRVITGGDAATLLPHLPGDWEPRPLLVLEGLAVLAQRRAPPGHGG